MILDFPHEQDVIRQGDIFVGIPRVELSLSSVLLLDEEGQRVAHWRELVEQGTPQNIIVPVRPVTAIVATQNCDALRSPDITLCEIRPFKDVERKCSQTSAPKKWKDIITQHARINLKWFYIPPEPTIGFTEKMAVDFLVTLRVPREDLEELRSARRARLNRYAAEHFRQRIGEFFRRYAYDEWYALDAQEMGIYQKDFPDVIPFPWQEQAQEGS